MGISGVGVREYNQRFRRGKVWSGVHSVGQSGAVEGVAGGTGRGQAAENLD